MARMTKNEKLAREGLMKNLVFLSQETWIPSTIALEVPEAWHTLEADVDVEEPKEKVTLYLDRSVARFYRAMGKGYHARINRLLATWAQMKIAGEVELEAKLKERLGWGEKVEVPEGEETETSPESDERPEA